MINMKGPNKFSIVGSWLLLCALVNGNRKIEGSQIRSQTHVYDCRYICICQWRFLLDSMSNSILFRSVVWWRGQAFDLIWWQTYQGLSQRTRLEEKPARLPSRTQSGKVRRPQDQAHRSNCNIERNAQLGGTINNFQCTFFSKVCPTDSFQSERGKRESEYAY